MKKQTHWLTKNKNKKKQGGGEEDLWAFWQ